MASQNLVRSADQRNPICFGGGRREKYWCLGCGSGRCGVVQYGGCGVVPKETVIANQEDALLCVQRGQDRGVERERREKMCEAKDPEHSRV